MNTPILLGILPTWFEDTLKAYVRNQRWDLDWSTPSELLSEVFDALEVSPWINGLWGTTEDAFFIEPKEGVPPVEVLNEFCLTFNLESTQEGWKVLFRQRCRPQEVPE